MSRASSRDASRSRKRASAGITVGALAAIAVALATSPLRKRLSATLPWLRLHSGSERANNDDVLTAEVRSRLDSVTDELGLAPVEVTVTNRVATVHGDVRSSIEAGLIDDAASAVPGIAGVISHLADFPDGGAGAGSNSQSPEFRELMAAARAAGCSEPAEAAAVRTVLAIFLEHLPVAERTGVLIHLPPDVRRMAITPRRTGIAAGMLPNTIDSLVEAVSHVVALPRDTSHEVVVAVLQTLRAVLPEEFRDIQGKLPLELADLWTVSPVPVESKPSSD